MTTRKIPHGLYYEDFEEGRRFDHHWARTFSESDALWYANMTMQYNPIYFSAPHAKAMGYEGILVHPLFAFTTALGLSVEDLSEAGGPFLGIDDLQFRRPVYPGDTIRSGSVVVSRRATASRPGWGVVEWTTIAVNQRSERVLEFRRRNLSKMRDAAKGV
ncbi:MaoC family dehydratase [Bradyrhizobium prioriisuperbiae]|uniref:MaoC family dehydratase n=1 Tax=Bradyrhizobium prioriisuperbiae TaxID=2854389 RepID=UPI0028E48B2F|nr:MaoC family dehydratase [Bradyrhizobium prioritasuperba]